MKELGRPLEEEEVMHMVEQLLDALEYIHGKGIFHLDLKPANAIVQEGSGIVNDSRCRTRTIQDRTFGRKTVLRRTQGAEPPAPKGGEAGGTVRKPGDEARNGQSRT